MTAAFSGSPKNCFADKLRLILTRVCKGEFELQSKSISSNRKTNGILDNSLIFNLVFKHKTVDVLSLEQQLKIIYVPWTMSYCLAIIQSPNPNYQSQPKLIKVHIWKHSQWPLQSVTSVTMRSK